MAKAMNGLPPPSALPASMRSEIHIPKLSHLVAARLREQIFSGQMAPGSVLMPEGKLLSLFNVSRPTLREALRILEAESLISIGRGMRAGALVLGPSLRRAAEYTSFMLMCDGTTMLDVHEARMFFEPAIVRSLSGSSIACLVEDLRACIASIQSALDGRRYLEVVACTNRFHETLVNGSGNKTVALLFGVLRTISDDAYAVVINSEPATPEALEKNMRKTVDGYGALCELLERGKAEEAASFWHRYMTRAHEFLKYSGIGARRIVVQREKGNGAASAEYGGA